MADQVCLPVTESSQIGMVRRAAIRLAESAGLPVGKCSDAGIIASELATNLARHAQAGRIFLRACSSTTDAWCELLAVDSGPGVVDLPRCLQDGYSSAGTSGIGFGAIRRLSDEFDVFSTEGRGTVVLSRLRRGGGGPTPVFLPGAPGETVCGDSWRIVDDGQQLAVLVADGLGHGPLASEAADLAAAVFEQDPFVSAHDFYGRAHARLRGTRGAAVARALVHARGTVDFAGVGNIASSLIGNGRGRGLPSQNGTVGAEMRRQVADLPYELPPHGVLVMHSDGVTGRWSLDSYPGLLMRHPAVIAAVLLRDFLRGRDDATVVAVSRAREAHAA
jgi:anti-sigma regulatory factor (Ser/Thr protein kinase)